MADSDPPLNAPDPDWSPEVAAANSRRPAGEPTSTCTITELTTHEQKETRLLFFPELVYFESIDLTLTHGEFLRHAYINEGIFRTSVALKDLAERGAVFTLSNEAARALRVWVDSIREQVLARDLKRRYSFGIPAGLLFFISAGWGSELVRVTGLLTAGGFFFLGLAGMLRPRRWMMPFEVLIWMMFSFRVVLQVMEGGSSFLLAFVLAGLYFAVSVIRRFLFWAPVPKT